MPSRRLPVQRKKLKRAGRTLVPFPASVKQPFYYPSLLAQFAFPNPLTERTQEKGNVDPYYRLAFQTFLRKPSL